MGEFLNNLVTPDFSASARSLPSERPKEMLTVQRDGPQTFVRINSSSLSLLQTCARKSMYVLHQGWRAKSGSPPLVFGTAIHKALEIFYQQPKKKRGDPPDAAFDEIALTIAHGYEPPADNFMFDAIKAFVKAAEPLKALPDTDKRSLASGTWLLSHYFRTYFNDTYVTHVDEHGPVTERTFSVPLIESANLKIELFGTIDFVLRNEATGALLPGDHKTSSQMGNDFLNRIKPNHQYTGYLFGANHALGLESEDFLVNGIQVKARPLTARGSPPTFTRQITKRTPDDFREFADAIDWAVRSYLKWEESECWPIGNVDACSMWGGCSYLDVCSAPNALRKNILEAKYTQEENGTTR